MGRKATETTRYMNQPLGHGTVNEYTARHLFTKFRNGDESLEDEERRGCPSAIDDIQLRAIIEADQCKAIRGVAEKLNIDHSTVVRHLHQTGKSKKARQVVPHEQSENHKIHCYKFCCVFLLRNKSNPFLDRILIYDDK
jgi:transposase